MVFVNMKFLIPLAFPRNCADIVPLPFGMEDHCTEKSEVQWAFFLASFLAYFFSLNAYKILFAPGYLNAGCSVSFFLRYRRTFNIQVQISLYYADFLLLYLGIPFCSIYFILFY